MSASATSGNGATGKIILLVAVIVLALGVIGFLAFKGGSASGTVDPQVKQMEPGKRGRH